MSKKVSYCLGMSLTIEALRQRPDVVREVWLSSKVKVNSFLKELVFLCEEHQIPYFENDAGIQEVSVKENCFAVGVFLPFTEKLNHTQQHIIFSNFMDEGALGTCIRSAISFDIHDIVLLGNQCDVFDSKTVRASMGAVFHCRIQFFLNIEEYLRVYDRPIYLLTAQEGKELRTIDFEKQSSLLISNNFTMKAMNFELFHVDAINLASPIYCAIVCHFIYQKRIH